jgi:hypothetical protein
MLDTYISGVESRDPSFSKLGEDSPSTCTGIQHGSEETEAEVAPEYRASGISELLDNEGWMGSFVNSGYETIGLTASDTTPHQADVICNFLANSTEDSLNGTILGCISAQVTKIIPPSLAYDLFEHYFSTSTKTFIQAEVSKLAAEHVDRCADGFWVNRGLSPQPALLVSILLVAAQTNVSRFLTIPPSARGKVSQKLLDLTIYLSKRLRQSFVDFPTIGEPAIPYPQARDYSADIATSFHLAIVIRSIEGSTAASIWWNAAFALMDRLKQTPGSYLCSNATF